MTIFLDGTKEFRKNSFYKAFGNCPLALQATPLIRVVAGLWTN